MTFSDGTPRGRARPAALCSLAVGAVLALLGTLLFVTLPSASAATSAATGAGAGYWHTSGNQILDANGTPVRIAGINWYGFETPDEIAHGLWVQDYHTVIDDIKKLGYNTIRIPFSNQMVQTPIVPQNIGFYNTGPINLDLKGLTALQDLQKIVTYAGQDGLKVILDDHRSEAGESAEDNGLWYTSTYTNQDWLNDWTTIATMFAGNPTVIGFDLRNEPHTPTGVAYANGATWGSGNTSTDIRLAYEAAGNAILKVDPNALIFCEGISEYPDSAASGGYDSTWWGGELEGVAQYPVTLSSAGHVVYSAHDYGPSLFQQTWFNSSTTSASLDAVWNQNWGYIYTQGIAPVWVGEFGTDNTASDVSSSAAGSQGQWFSSLVSYIASNKWMGWTYWALNGEDSFSLLDGSYDPTPVSAAKQSLLASIEFPLPGAQNGTAPPSGSASASASASASGSTGASASAAPTGKSSATCTYSVTNSWSGGFQAQVVVADTGTAPINGYTLAWTFPGDQKINNMWGGTYTQSGEAVSVTPASYTADIPAGSSATIGFTGTYTSSDTSPTSFTLNGAACSA
ncbi:cellulase family glycosylhydrolase [Actinospica robiniae]|uniref:cellulase family glycosylhydrolase n=1 Tax=Actinospica robiniae TaxID=304901 RepID=UPI0004218C37|nr:cellulase family glycosylhydrolase [Actinospica robiniae]